MPPKQRASDRVPGYDIVMAKSHDDGRLPDAHLRATVDAIAHLAWVARPDGTPEYLNARCPAYFGLPLAELLVGACASVVHPDDWSRVCGAWGECVRHG